MSKGVQEKAKHYYDKALNYSPTKRTFGDDGYEVYAQCLFDVLYGKNAPSDEKQLYLSVFHAVLQDWVENKKSFDFSDFKQDVQSRYNKRKNKGIYTFIFGVHIKTYTKGAFPFKRQFGIGDTTFRILSRRYANKVTNGELIKELHDLYAKKRYQEPWIEQTLKDDYVFFQATTHSIDSVVAANKMTSQFELLMACATIAQERHSRTYSTSGPVKSKQPILLPHSIYWVNAPNPFESILVVLGADIQVPDAFLTFSEDPAKLKSFKRYLAIIDKPKLSPIENRIKDVLLEFDRALSATDANTRMLSMWKCLEIASRLENGATRKYSEIIDIIRNYHDNDVVNEKARLVQEARNEYVHQGVAIDYEKRDNYLRWVHDFVSAYLGLLMWMRLKGIGAHSAKEIDKLFDFYRQSDEDLAIAGKLLHARRKNRKKYEQMKQAATE